MIGNETGGESLAAHNQIRRRGSKQRQRRSGGDEGRACAVIACAIRIGRFAVLMMGWAVIGGGIRAGSRIVMRESAKPDRRFRHRPHRDQKQQQDHQRGFERTSHEGDRTTQELA